MNKSEIFTKSLLTIFNRSKKISKQIVFQKIFCYAESKNLFNLIYNTEKSRKNSIYYPNTKLSFNINSYYSTKSFSSVSESSLVSIKEEKKIKKEGEKKILENFFNHSMIKKKNQGRRNEIILNQMIKFNIYSNSENLTNSEESQETEFYVENFLKKKANIFKFENKENLNSKIKKKEKIKKKTRRIQNSILFKNSKKNNLKNKLRKLITKNDMDNSNYKRNILSKNTSLIINKNSIDLIINEKNDFEQIDFIMSSLSEISRISNF